MSSNKTNIAWTRRTYHQLCVESGTRPHSATEEAAAGETVTIKRREVVRIFGVASRLILNSLSIFVLSWVFGLAVLATAPYLIGFDTVVVGSQSMEPSLRVADVVILTDPTDRQVDEGSVINYWADEATRIHRVIEITPDGYRTKGDANPTPDSTTVTPAAVTGIGIYIVPFIGWPHQWYTDGDWLKLIASTVILMLLASTERPGFVDRPQRRTDSRIGPVRVNRRQRPVAS